MESACMGITENLQLIAVHTHANLLGWVSFALAGIIYTLLPQCSLSILGKLHFWLYVFGVPSYLIGQAMKLELLPLSVQR
ncbi:hypothetical protein [Shimazuella soli]|uniref:hypothetical protein n=1 Tax=Shimazuella soli TaxID=1892854 RepID=UPI001F113EA1|nr:hypothetical protein [Shimazuella soli]